MNHALLKSLVFKKLNIQPDGSLVSGGYASYTLDPAQGHISFQGTFIAHYFFSDHTFPFSGVYAVDPELLKSKNVKVGERIAFGNVTIEVTGVWEKTATAHVVVEGKVKAEGTVELSLAGDTIEVVSIEATGKAFGFTANVKAS